MLLIIGAVLVFMMVVIIARASVGLKDGAIGWMSERWLAQHRTQAL